MIWGCLGSFFRRDFWAGLVVAEDLELKGEVNLA
jgi:hypothetical protein